MNIDIFPLISFVIITTFTPGPNNISSASMGIIYGYNKTIRFIFGITSGFFLLMLLCAFLSSTLLSIIPVSERYLRWIGALYIVWLAVGILRSNKSFKETNDPPKAFAKGFILQLINPKATIYGLTLYSTFLSPIAGQIQILTILAVIFAFALFVLRP